MVEVQFRFGRRSGEATRSCACLPEADKAKAYAAIPDRHMRDAFMSNPLISCNKSTRELTALLNSVPFYSPEARIMQPGTSLRPRPTTTI